MPLNLAADRWDWSALWQIPLTVASLVCAMIMVAEGQTRTHSHVTLNLHR
jgi:hypothetical protein